MAISKTQAYCLTKDKILKLLAVKSIESLISKKLFSLKVLSLGELKNNSFQKEIKLVEGKKERQRELEFGDSQTQVRLIKNVSYRSSGQHLFRLLKDK